MAIQACAKAGVDLVVAGDGPQRAALEQLAGGSGAEGRVRFTGRLDREALTTLRATCSVELVPSRAHETFGLAAIEALAAGLPVVASAVGALAALPAPVCLVPPGDADALAVALAQARDSPPQAAVDGVGLARGIAGADVVAPALAEVYALARARRAGR